MQVFYYILGVCFKAYANTKYILILLFGITNFAHILILTVTITMLIKSELVGVK